MEAWLGKVSVMRNDLDEEDGMEAVVRDMLVQAPEQRATPEQILQRLC
jgi:hypothetical protein